VKFFPSLYLDETMFGRHEHLSFKGAVEEGWEQGVQLGGGLPRAVFGGVRL
jgi:hypothetical protein